LSTDFLPIQSFDQPQLLHPGEIVPVDIAIMPASEVFHAGEQLRLTIAGHEFSAPPATQPASGLLSFMSALPPLPTKNAGVHVIHGGGDHQSFLQIPVIPADTSGELDDRSHSLEACSTNLDEAPSRVAGLVVAFATCGA
jgi:predicted acyl esterase